MRCHRTCMSQLEYSNLKLFDGPNLWLWTKNTSTFVSQGCHEYRTSPKETVVLYIIMIASLSHHLLTTFQADAYHMLDCLLLRQSFISQRLRGYRDAPFGRPS